MTNQEAISSLKVWVERDKKILLQNDADRLENIEIYNMAIKALEQEPKTGHCEDCKHFRKLPYHTDTLGKCIHHTGFCPKGDWYCGDYKPQESEEISDRNLKMWEEIFKAESEG